MNEKMRTSVSFNFNKPQRELFKMICTMENRSMTEQTEFVLKRSLVEWFKKNKNEIFDYEQNKENQQLKKIVEDPTILLK